MDTTTPKSQVKVLQPCSTNAYSYGWRFLTQATQATQSRKNNVTHFDTPLQYVHMCKQDGYAYIGYKLLQNLQLC